MSPRTREHEEAVAWLNEWLVLGVDHERYQVRPASALTFERLGSEPEPDFAVVARGAPRPYHPGSAALVIEVSRSSIDRDLRVKAFLYGAAAIEEYWVVDLDGGLVWVHRWPEAAGGYGMRMTTGYEHTVEAEALALPPLDVGALLAAARGPA